jgi:menaquinone-specific isochorismate synthase
MTADPAYPALVVETSRIDPVANLLALADPIDPLVWFRRDAGMVGLGVALRIDLEGPDRIARTAEAWRRVVDAATVTDAVGMPGTGLVAFGAIAFSGSSALPSTLVVPRTIVGRRDGASWITTIRPADEDAPETAAHPSTAAVPTVPDSHPVDTRAIRIATALRARAGAESPVTVLEPRPPLPPSVPAGAEYRLSLLPGLQSADGHRAAVRAVLDAIEAGEAQKVVLARDLRAHLPLGSDLRRAVGRLARGYPDCWVFAVDGLVGASPETLVRVHGGTANARVLAGTASRGADGAADAQAALTLAASPKDQDEHRFAVASVMSTLEPHSSAITSSDTPFTLKLPNLWHLATDIEASLGDGSTALDLVGALHPTAAVAGAPTDAALRLIETLEPFDRGRYAGPVGWVDAAGDGEWAIALRCAQVDADGSLTAYAGGGIVAGSEPERELAETKMKFRPIVDAFG